MALVEIKQGKSKSSNDIGQCGGSLLNKVISLIIVSKVYQIFK
jgi:hypothetical protein